MNWADSALRFLVRRRDRETIIGDLLEEYREEIRPTKGPLSARLWYARQVLSFMGPVAWGLLIGLAAGSLQLLDTAIAPLREDTPSVMLVIVGALMLLWIVTSAVAERSSGRFRDAVVAGVLVGAATMAVLHVSAIVRVNVFLEQIRDRGDWVNLLSRFQASGYESLRVYANYEYLRQSPLLLALGAIVGGLCGSVGGSIIGIGRKPLTGLSR